MDVCFVLWVTIQHYIIYSVAHIVPALAFRSSVRWLLCPFDISPSMWRVFCFVVFFFLTLPSLLALQDSPGSPCMFLAPALKSTSSVRNSGSFCWTIVLETKIWALGVFLATGPLQVIEKVLCVLTGICTHTCKCFSV